ncbi:hypothetical protein CB0940_00175 [Cercospora beticola]|uniref:Zn(2)-C6 fungal-type domain-containing protein n=1 Tax=Cercospora beticola TaxID=122368 RepID=A0A2G5IDE4_CERBT|nr:hypothetical protein CB0940_00175 [Cercospora beticola]PIB02544.1 hypothetical protein CB0940_00175 [Cercospora beticola]WPA95578.1 hypothetical protein RHO25_000180 [Cercospora beticola]
MDAAAIVIGAVTTPEASRKRKRARQACDHCRAKKIRCNGENVNEPCPNCIDRGNVCVTTRNSRRVPQITSAVPAPTNTDSPAPPQDANVTADSGLSADSVFVHDDNADTTEQEEDALHVSPDALRERSSILPSDMTNWEYHGPRSFLSICSRPAVKWVSEQTGRLDFSETASQFASDISRRLKMDADLSVARAPEPGAETAWRYTEAYFSTALDASLGVLCRPWFERQLSAHLAGRLCDSGPAWHALRNVVYAAGCRIELSKSRLFKEASQQAWLYFENALAVYARLLFYKTSIMGVQALTLMAYYTQNIGTPCLEYMLSADAARLAFAKGLHRAAPPFQGMTEQDVEQRNRIFWAIYCLEKQIANQSGRSSMIDDDEVTCPLPRMNASGDDAFNIAYCDSLVRISRICSRIDKRLSAVQCSTMGPAVTTQVVNQLHAELEGLKNLLHDKYKLHLGARIDTSCLPKDFRLDQLVYLQYTYLTAMLNVHTIWAYPWFRTLVGLSTEDKYRDHILRSTEIVARTSREIVVMTEHINFRAQTTVPVAFFAPIYAMISLFIYCLDRGKSSSDLAMLDIGTGYFARLGIDKEFALYVPFVRAITSLAYGLEGSTHHQEPIVRSDAIEMPNLGEDFWQTSLLDADTLMQLEDWSTFSRTSPV